MSYNPRVRIAATLAVNDVFEMFAVQYRITETPMFNEFGGVVVRFRNADVQGHVHTNTLVLPPNTPFHIL